MHSVFNGIAISLIVVASVVGEAAAVGHYSPGREDCSCCPMVASGIAPDILNGLTDFPGWRTLINALDRFGTGIRAVIGQFGAPAGEDSAKAPESALATPKQTSIPPKQVAAAKPKEIKDKPKAKKVKRPPEIKRDRGFPQ
jgi:hypothetical protein